MSLSYEKKMQLSFAGTLFYDIFIFMKTNTTSKGVEGLQINKATCIYASAILKFISNSMLWDKTRQAFMENWGSKCWRYSPKVGTLQQVQPFSYHFTLVESKHSHPLYS